MKWISRIEDGVLGISMILATAVLFMNVVLRYFFNANTTWAEEFIRFVMVWITFVGSSVCFRKGMHVGIDLILLFTSKTVSRYLHIFITILSLFLMICLVKYGWQLVIFSKETGQISPAMGIPMYWVYLGIPVGAVFSIFHLLKIMMENVQNKSDVIDEKLPAEDEPDYKIALEK